jgi:DNA-binding transcriptional MerR regulator
MANSLDSRSRESASSASDKRQAAKSAAAFRTISEVAEELDVPQHVLRFWESKFTTVRPLKRGGGRRYYRPEDVELIRQIRNLLYADGYTIKGVQRLMREGQLRASASQAGVKTAASAKAAPKAAPRALDARGLIAELTELRDMLRASLR